jgi:hypothetical protein
VYSTACPLEEHEVPEGHEVVIPLPLRSQALVCHPRASTGSLCLLAPSPEGCVGAYRAAPRTAPSKLGAQLIIL